MKQLYYGLVGTAFGGGYIGLAYGYHRGTLLEAIACGIWLAAALPAWTFFLQLYAEECRAIVGEGWDLDLMMLIMVIVPVTAGVIGVVSTELYREGPVHALGFGVLCGITATIITVMVLSIAVIDYPSEKTDGN